MAFTVIVFDPRVISAPITITDAITRARGSGDCRSSRGASFHLASIIINNQNPPTSRATRPDVCQMHKSALSEDPPHSRVQNQVDSVPAELTTHEHALHERRSKSMM